MNSNRIYRDMVGMPFMRINKHVFFHEKRIDKSGLEDFFSPVHEKDKTNMPAHGIKYPSVFCLYGIALYFFSEAKWELEKICYYSNLRIYIDTEKFFEISPLHPLVFKFECPANFFGSKLNAFLGLFPDAYSQAGLEKVMTNNLNIPKYYSLLVDGGPRKIDSGNLRVQIMVNTAVNTPFSMTVMLHGLLATPVEKG